MNRFDQFAKHKLKAKYYIRYADDFVILSDNKNWLENQISKVKGFLKHELKLELHPDKVFIKTYFSGVDFLGLINFPEYRILRTKTKKRIIKKISKKHDLLQRGLLAEESYRQSLEPYLGILKHCNGYKVAGKLKQANNLSN